MGAWKEALSTVSTQTEHVLQVGLALGSYKNAGEGVGVVGGQVMAGKMHQFIRELTMILCWKTMCSQK